MPALAAMIATGYQRCHEFLSLLVPQLRACPGQAMCFKFTHADYYAADIFVCTDKTALNLFKTKPILFGNDRIRTVCHKTVPSFKSPTSRIRLSTFGALSHRIYGTKT